jgi:hypothetical protein
MHAMAEHAHQLIDQFLTRQRECPDRAWECVAELQQLVEQLRSCYPARTFRRRTEPI